MKPFNCIRLTIPTALVLIASCSSIDTLVDESSPTMEQIYQSTTRSPANDLVQQHRTQRHEQASIASNPYSFDPHFLSAKTHTDNLFQKLPNPIIYMYVKPHPVGESGSPVPGYITKFYLYERDHFAQPGEVVIQDKKPESL